MELLSGPELDRRIARLLQGNDARPAAYSTSAVASQRLVRQLAESLGLACEVEEAEGAFYCRLKRGEATIATGSAETREMAVARAAGNLSPQILGSAPPPRADGMAPAAAPTVRPKRGARRASVPCDICGVPMKPPPVASPRRLCNPCSYRVLMDAARERDRAER